MSGNHEFHGVATHIALKKVIYSLKNEVPANEELRKLKRRYLILDLNRRVVMRGFADLQIYQIFLFWVK